MSTCDKGIHLTAYTMPSGVCKLATRSEITFIFQLVHIQSGKFPWKGSHIPRVLQPPSHGLVWNAPDRSHSMNMLGPHGRTRRPCKLLTSCPCPLSRLLNSRRLALPGDGTPSFLPTSNGGLGGSRENRRGDGGDKSFFFLSLSLPHMGGLRVSEKTAHTVSTGGALPALFLPLLHR